MLNLKLDLLCPTVRSYHTLAYAFCKVAAKSSSAKGWHTHYDHIDEGFNFLKSPSELELFEDEKFDKKYLVERLSSIGTLDLK